MPKYTILSVLSPCEKFTYSSRGQKPRSWHQHGQFLSKSSSEMQTANLSSCSQWCKEKKPALWFLIRTLIPTSRALPSWPNYFSKVSPPNTITSGISFQHKVWGDGDESHYPVCTGHFLSSNVLHSIAF